MIKSLYIRNYAIIENLEVHFSKGLTIITGETGAGKSILLGALGLIMGNRAETKVLYEADKKCVVEGRFNIKAYGLNAFFAQNDLDYDEDVVIRREIVPSGKSRAFINDTPVNLKILQDVSSKLIDLHQQFDTLSLQEQQFQLNAIDALAENRALLVAYRNGYQTLKANQHRLAQLKSKNKEVNNQTDFIKFQLEELLQAQLVPDEQPRLEQEQLQLDHAEAIKMATNAAFQQLSEQELSIIGQLQEIGMAINQVKAYHPQLASLYDRLDSITLEIRDLSNEFENLAEQTEFDPQRNQEVRDRLDLIYRLQNKHQCASVSELLTLAESLDKQLTGFDELDQEIASLEKTIADQELALKEQALEISQRRQGVTQEFQRAAELLLVDLAMPHATLEVAIHQQESLNDHGIDHLEFLFSANKGGKLLPIREVASGGELSRLALVIKSLVASAIPLPTLVFDEIDSGISGDVALKMGNILKKVATGHQVITITHAPQVAAKADIHYFVYKAVNEERTITNVRLLDQEERIKEIAIMLSQNPPSDFAIANARELVSL